jgi:pimeloyl-ACP methyl ester carboxylesterase
MSDPRSRVVGHPYGGGSATNVAIRAPKRAERLGPIAPAFLGC